MGEIWSIAASAAISVLISVLVTTSVRLSIERKFVAAANAAAENKKRRVRFTAIRSAWQGAATRLFFHLVRIAQNREQPNGELERAYLALEEADRDRAEMEHTYAAEAQEE